MVVSLQTGLNILARWGITPCSTISKCSSTTGRQTLSRMDPSRNSQHLTSFLVEIKPKWGSWTLVSSMMTNSRRFSVSIIIIPRLHTFRTLVTTCRISSTLHLWNKLISLRHLEVLQLARWGINPRSYEPARAPLRSIILRIAVCTISKSISHLPTILGSSSRNTGGPLKSEIFLMMRNTSRSRMSLISRKLTRSW
jgi:hypothetical protein